MDNPLDEAALFLRSVRFISVRVRRGLPFFLIGYWTNVRSENDLNWWDREVGCFSLLLCGGRAVANLMLRLLSRLVSSS